MIEIGSWRRNTALEDALRETGDSDPTTYQNLYAERQRLVREQLAENLPLIVAMALRGTPTKVIAAALAVSVEAINGRLRVLGLANPQGARGRFRPTFDPPGASQ